MITTLHMTTPLGPLLLEAEEDVLVAVRFDAGPGAAGATMHGGDSDPPAVLRAARDQLADYFAGRRAGFALPLRPRGTAFQRRVWQALADVPFGRTASYGELAERLGLPASHARAVGAAIGRNPLLVVVPCHRAIGRDGSLTGYAGGLPRKRALLALEAAGHPEPSRSPDQR